MKPENLVYLPTQAKIRYISDAIKRAKVTAAKPLALELAACEAMLQSIAINYQRMEDRMRSADDA